MSIKRERKITFPNVGIEQGSRVWRNSETGVEIIKGKNFAEVGLYYVCIPAAPKDMCGPVGRRIVGSQFTLAMARSMAIGYVMYMRAAIATAHTEACLEDSNRDGERLSNRRAIDNMARRMSREAIRIRAVEAAGDMRGMHMGPGHVAPATILKAWNEALDEHSSRYWGQATDGMPRVPAFGAEN